MNADVLWLQNNGKILSELGINVAEILGATWRGIYHLDAEVLHKRVNWNSGNYIHVVVSESLATFDSDKLTQLVIRCHDKAIRLDIRGQAHGYLALYFSPRTRSGSISQRHPTIQMAINNILGCKNADNTSLAMQLQIPARDIDGSNLPIYPIG